MCCQSVAILMGPTVEGCKEKTNIKDFFRIRYLHGVSPQVSCLSTYMIRVMMSFGFSLKVRTHIQGECGTKGNPVSRPANGSRQPACRRASQPACQPASRHSAANQPTGNQIASSHGAPMDYQPNAPNTYPNYIPIISQLYPIHISQLYPNPFLLGYL